MSRALRLLSLILAVSLANIAIAFPEEYKTFKTDHTSLHYAQDSLLSDFLWRIGGLKFDQNVEASLAKSRVDRIIERVQTVLDMYPEDFHIDIYLTAPYKDGNIAFYSETTGSITVYVDRVTDGVLAHEIAHAVMYEYFEVPPPRKVQEILARYADLHLWQDY